MILRIAYSAPRRFLRNHQTRTKKLQGRRPWGFLFFVDPPRKRPHSRPDAKKKPRRANALVAAQGASGDFGFGIGETEKVAGNAALANCKHNAIGPSRAAKPC